MQCRKAFVIIKNNDCNESKLSEIRLKIMNIYLYTHKCYITTIKKNENFIQIQHTTHTNTYTQNKITFFVLIICD